jgi:hypothetical protein
MIVDRFVNIASQAAALASNSSKSNFEDVKAAVASASTGSAPVVVVTSPQPRVSATDLLLSIVVFVLILAIILVVGLWLWNNVAVKYITIFRPLPNVWYLLGLIIIIDLIHPGCMCGSGRWA